MFLKHTETGKPDLMTTLITMVTTAAVIKFLLDGVTITWSGNTIDMGHLDSLTYSALLAPVLGLHGWLEKTKSATSKEVVK